MKNLTGYIYCQRNRFEINKPTTYLSTAIQLIATVQYNHCGIIVQDHTGIWLYEAIKDGVVKVDFKERIKDKTYETDYILLEPTYRNFNQQVVINECKWLQGIEYDYSNLFWQQLLWNTLNIWVGARSQSKALKRLICYELVWYIHRRSNTLKNEWWKSKPKYIYMSSEFKKVNNFTIY